MPESTSTNAVPSAQELDALVVEHSAFVRSSLRGFGYADADADDLSQDVFVVVHRRYAAFDGRSAVTTWLYGICLRVAADHRKRAHVRREVPTDELPEPGTRASVPDVVQVGQARARLEAVLDGLDANQRAAFVLHDLEERSLAEVAEVTKTPLQTVYSRVRAARRFVEDAIARVAAREAA